MNKRLLKGFGTIASGSVLLGASFATAYVFNENKTHTLEKNKSYNLQDKTTSVKKENNKDSLFDNFWESSLNIKNGKSVMGGYMFEAFGRTYVSTENGVFAYSKDLKKYDFNLEIREKEPFLSRFGFVYKSHTGKVYLAKSNEFYGNNDSSDDGIYNLGKDGKTLTKVEFKFDNSLSEMEKNIMHWHQKQNKPTFILEHGGMTNVDGTTYIIPGNNNFPILKFNEETNVLSKAFDNEAQVEKGNIEKQKKIDDDMHSDLLNHRRFIKKINNTIYVGNGLDGLQKVSDDKKTLINISKIDLRDGFIHESINHQIYIGTKSGLYTLKDNVLDKKSPLDFSESFAFNDGNNTYVGTRKKGIKRINGKNEIIESLPIDVCGGFAYSKNNSLIIGTFKSGIIDFHKPLAKYYESNNNPIFEHKISKLVFNKENKKVIMSGEEIYFETTTNKFNKLEKIGVGADKRYWAFDDYKLHIMSIFRGQDSRIYLVYTDGVRTLSEDGKISKKKIIEWDKKNRSPGVKVYYNGVNQYLSYSTITGTITYKLENKSTKGKFTKTNFPLECYINDMYKDYIFYYNSSTRYRILAKISADGLSVESSTELNDKYHKLLKGNIHTQGLFFQTKNNLYFQSWGSRDGGTFKLGNNSNITKLPNDSLWNKNIIFFLKQSKRIILQNEQGDWKTVKDDKIDNSIPDIQVPRKNIKNLMNDYEGNLIFFSTDESKSKIYTMTELAKPKLTAYNVKENYLNKLTELDHFKYHYDDFDLPTAPEGTKYQYRAKGSAAWVDKKPSFLNTIGKEKYHDLHVRLVSVDENHKIVGQESMDQIIHIYNKEIKVIVGTKKKSAPFVMIGIIGGIGTLILSMFIFGIYKFKRKNN